MIEDASCICWFLSNLCLICNLCRGLLSISLVIRNTHCPPFGGCLLALDWASSNCVISKPTSVCWGSSLKGFTGYCRIHARQTSLENRQEMKIQFCSRERICDRWASFGILVSGRIFACPSPGWADKARLARALQAQTPLDPPLPKSP
jgi:hypothetical protein